MIYTHCENCNQFFQTLRVFIEYNSTEFSGSTIDTLNLVSTKEFLTLQQQVDVIEQFKKLRKSIKFICEQCYFNTQQSYVEGFEICQKKLEEYQNSFHCNLFEARDQFNQQWDQLNQLLNKVQEFSKNQQLYLENLVDNSDTIKQKISSEIQKQIALIFQQEARQIMDILQNKVNQFDQNIQIFEMNHTDPQAFNSKGSYQEIIKEVQRECEIIYSNFQ